MIRLKADAMLSSVSSGFLHLVAPISYNSRLHHDHAVGIKSHKLWYQVGSLVIPVPQAGKIAKSILLFFQSSRRIRTLEFFAT